MNEVKVTMVNGDSFDIFVEENNIEDLLLKMYGNNSLGRVLNVYDLVSGGTVMLPSDKICSIVY